jgi:hypothetical protein
MLGQEQRKEQIITTFQKISCIISSNSGNIITSRCWLDIPFKKNTYIETNQAGQNSTITNTIASYKTRTMPV